MAETTTNPVIDTKATTVDSEVDNETTNDTEPTTVTEAVTKITPNNEDFAKLQQQARQKSTIEASLASAAQALETNQHFAELGCFYGGAAPVANSFGAEIGVVTKDDKTNTVQRTGVGFYIRSDHARNIEFDLSA